MNRLKLMAAMFLAAAAHASPVPPPSGSARGDGERVNVFVGAYGETIEYDADDKVSAEMRGPVEVIRGISALIKDPKTGGVLRRPPSAMSLRDFALPNYEPLELVEALVIPRASPGGYPSLAAMRAAKEKELAATGARFEIFPDGYDFPEGSFVVIISSPYGMRQTYTQSRDHFFIVSSGRETLGLHGRFLHSVSRHVRKSIPRSQESVWSDLQQLNSWNRYQFGAWGILMAAAVLMTLLPVLSRSRAARRMRVLGLSVIVWTNVLMIYAVAAMVAFRLAGFLPNGDILGFLPGLVAPLLFPYIAKSLGGRYESRWRYLLFALCLYIIADTFRIRGSFWLPSDVNTEMEMFSIWSIGASLGLLHGVFFGMGYQSEEREADHAAD